MASRVIVNRNLKSLHEALQLTPAAMQDCTDTCDYIYRGQEDELFRTEGRSGGAAWQALSEPYKKRKDRLFSGARSYVSGIAKARGRGLTGAALNVVLGAENKILQLTGDMKRAFSNLGGRHVAHYFILPGNARVQLGAQGPEHYALHAEGDGKLPKRDPQQRTSTQDEALRGGVKRALAPHVARALRVALQAGTPFRAGGSGA